MQLARQNGRDDLQVNLGPRFPHLLDDGRPVLREIVVQGQDEFLIELVAAANRPAAGSLWRKSSAQPGLPIRE